MEKAHLEPPDMRIFLPHSLALSSTVTCAPARFANSAAVSPDAPPPMTTTCRIRERRLKLLSKEHSCRSSRAAGHMAVTCYQQAVQLEELQSLKAAVRLREELARFAWAGLRADDDFYDCR